MDLVILAAGMGSRFGGLKQIEPIDKYGNFIIDYSIYDAKKAGFDKVIFIIKEENYEIFKSTIGSRIEKQIKVEYCFQKITDVPQGYNVPKDRIKPFGTAQAMLAAKDLVSDKFIIINADDFYGADAYKVAANYLNSIDSSKKGQYANVAYEVANTMTENGSVKRGVLSFDDSHELKDLIESKIEKKNGEIVATPLDGSPSFIIPRDREVSMNMFCFTKDIMTYLEEGFIPFMEAHKDNLSDCEYLLPTLVSELIEKGKASVKVLHTSSVWYGITYKEDKADVVNSLEKLVNKGEYKPGLFINK